MDQYIGKLLDNRYEILERIGSGGMAVVYKARCHRLNRLVAIKILKEDLAQDEEFRRRFHDESQAVAMLSHPNIMAVYDVSKSGEVDYIVMELLDGITLQQYMQKRGGKLSWREALHFITQIMKALSHAHGRGIIHRDIKPHNIMVLRDGSIKVADFGIARLTSAAQNTLTQEALGSVHYISPEQARGSHIDARSDIYSAGVVLYEMVTGRLPYEGDSPVSVAIQHINSIPLSPREIDPEIPEALEAITMKAMASDMNKRYLSADAMLADLEEFRKNPNINFNFTLEDLTAGDGDEPTQILGANTPSTVQHHPHHSAPRQERQTQVSAPKRKPRPAREELDYDDDYDRRDRRGGPWPVVIAVVAILLFVVGIGYFLYSFFFSGLMGAPTTYTVPEVTGFTVEQAEKLTEVKTNGFTIEVSDTVPSDTVPKGEIISQDPEKETTVQAGSRTIKVMVSGGAGEMTMPDVYNKDQRLALSQLSAMGLEVTVETENSEDITKDNVIRQEPAASVTVKAGDKATIVVSLGPESKPVSMISCAGMSMEQLKSSLKDLKLTLGKVEEVYSEMTPGVIVDQDVKAGTEIPEGTVVNFTISKGPDPVPVTPTPTPTPEVTPTPTPVVTPGNQVTITVTLPQDGRETVNVRIQVGSEENFVYDKDVQTNLQTIKAMIPGSGKQQVTVYIDGVVDAASSQTVDFDA